jgi:voltage-gated potassium channel
MTAPDAPVAVPPSAHPRAMKALTRKRLTAGRAARMIAAATALVTVVGGVLIHFTDPTSFPNVGVGMWWAIQTVTTVGYGDVVPTSTPGRAVASLVMIVGIAFLTVVTATITSAFIETARRRIDGTTQNALAERLDQIAARLDAIDASLRDGRGSGS